MDCPKLKWFEEKAPNQATWRCRMLNPGCIGLQNHCPELEVLKPPASTMLDGEEWEPLSPPKACGVWVGEFEELKDV